MIVHLVASIIVCGCFIFSGYFIKKYMKKYENAELFIVPYLLSLAICLSIAFL